MNGAQFHLDGISRSFGSLHVIQDLSLTIKRGEFVAIVGPSGCGKTTLLNILSGFDHPTSGSIETEGQIRMIYQQDGLFPWLTVKQNIALGLRHLSQEPERKQQIRDLLHLIGLENFEAHYPHQLSGGMRQRVELARGLAGNSDSLLMDEPFSSLDYLTRLRMRQELARILRERPRTVVLVTHDIEEAAQLADRVIVLSDRPARIREELHISAPSPRDPTEAQVVEAVRHILSKLNFQSEAEQWTASSV
jgi:ABC-type nitrate/sulfonate/bicarbonate transport system ATPase subunit